MFKRILDLKLADELCEAGLLWYDFHSEYEDPTVGVIPEVEGYPRPCFTSCWRNDGVRQYIEDVDKAVELFNAGLLWRDFNGNRTHPSNNVYPLTRPMAWVPRDIRNAYYHHQDGGFFVLLEE